MKGKKVGVIGCGTMGSGIARVALQGQYEVVVREADTVLLSLTCLCKGRKALGSR
jgi:3-hydroxyacyl-CoA dehydrogenase